MKAITVILAIIALVTFYPAWIQNTEVIAVNQHREGAIIGKKDASIEDVSELAVIAWSPEKQSGHTFQVVYKDGSWVIPSHYDYPADAGEQVGKTAGSVLGVSFERFITDDKDRYAELGVNDPSAEGVDGRGKRVVLKNAQGEVLIDAVIGVQQEDNSANRYVREFKSSDVYTAAIDFQFSNNFSDWVNSDLVDVSLPDVAVIMKDDYRVDEKTMQVINRVATNFNKNIEWESPSTPEGQEVNKETLQRVVNAISGLDLVGVRPFHTNARWMRKHGIFMTQKGGIMGNEGQLIFGTKKGLRYHVFFGEIATDADMDNLPNPADYTDEKTEEANTEPSNGSNHYIAIFVQYDPELDAERLALVNAPTPVAPAEGEEPKTEGKKSIEDHEKEGTEEAEQLNARYSKYFYVVENSDYFDLKPSLESCFKAIEKKETAAPVPTTP